MKPFTVIYVMPESPIWKFLNCYAIDGDNASMICEAHYPTASVLWVNEGHDKKEML